MGEKIDNIVTYLFDSAMTLSNVFFGPAVRLYPIYLVVFVIIGLAIFFVRKPKGISFFGWFFPPNIYLHPSHMLDIKLFILNRILTGAGLFGKVTITVSIITIVGQTLRGIFGAHDQVPVSTTADLVFITLLLALTADFTTYWVHRVFHTSQFLWPFHSVHHSAEVMTPLTTYRKHPLYDLCSALCHSIMSGLLQGILLFAVYDELSVITIGAINSAYFLFNILGSNFRHTHISLSYGNILEHILISPTQHQIHHSLKPEHHNKNYGEIFALWDTFFGTLCLSKPGEKLSFGLANQNGVRIPQPHQNFEAALREPILTSFKIKKEPS